jgi:hypothetical protein
MRDIAAKKGDFTLFAKIRRADAPGTWDLVVSAPWLEAGKLKATSELVELLSDSVGENSLHEFSRIQTVGADQVHVGQPLRGGWRATRAEYGPVRAANCRSGGIPCEETCSDSAV